MLKLQHYSCIWSFSERLDVQLGWAVFWLTDGVMPSEARCCCVCVFPYLKGTLLTKDLADQWMQHFLLLYHISSAAAMAYHCKLQEYNYANISCRSLGQSCTWQHSNRVFPTHQKCLYTTEKLWGSKGKSPRWIKIYFSPVQFSFNTGKKKSCPFKYKTAR